MIEKKHITGIVLAGGKSRRMGTEKGLVMYHGQTFIQYSLEALKPLVGEILIASDNDVYDQFEVKRVTDLFKDAGPLAGLYSGLVHSKTNYNLVLSCDLPLIKSFVLQKLVDEIPTEKSVVQLKVKDKTMPLSAVYHKKCTSKILALLRDKQLRVTKAVEQLGVKTITLEKEWEKYLSNVNTMEKLQFI